VSEHDYVEIISHMRLKDAERRFEAWLEDHGLTLSVFQGDEVQEDIARGKDGGSYGTFRIRRSALEKLLPGEYGPKVVKLPRPSS